MPNLEGTTGLSPLIKWAGGKDKELKIIIDNVPKTFNKYYEPFVGGGAVFMAMKANHYYINDLSCELYAFYKNVAEKDAEFYKYAVAINRAWSNIGKFVDLKMNFLLDKYIEYRNDLLSENQLKVEIHSFCVHNRDEIAEVVIGFPSNQHTLDFELEKSVSNKMSRMKSLEKKKKILPERDLKDNIETAIRGALYMYFRGLYNDKELTVKEPKLFNALFLFIRNYAFSGMFRYNDDGDFNVPYGGIAYNHKSLDKKLQYYLSDDVMRHFEKSTIENLDFETFMHKYKPNDDDFVFLDPPYDSEFSTYAKNDFNRNNQKRLANYLINECRGKWMMIIKQTDFIRTLYNNHEGVNIVAFDKKYQVSFMNRNNKNVEHLLIKNY